MKSRDPSDPTSWSFQANIHGTLGPVTSPLFNQCEHGTIQFFTWHRGYLYYFERILREASGDPSLTLPYWDWTAQRALPIAFRDPSDSTNPLYDATRFINDGSELPTPVVSDDLDTALGFVEFMTALFTGFSPSLEGSPHGAVHVLIGGNMGSVPTAANDPIFWLHHCNIDRIWNRWLNLGGGRANPTDPAFLDQVYSYADAGGATATVRVRDILTSARLGYQYDDVPNPAAEATLALSPAAGLSGAAAAGQGPKVVASSAPAGAALAAAEARPLGFAPETVELAITPEGGPALRDAAGAAAPDRRGQILLDVKGLAFEQPPSFTYDVFLNLPADETDAETARLHRVGAVNFFVSRGHGAPGHGAQGGPAGTFDQRFDATRAVARLREAGRWHDDALSVTLRPVTPVAPAGGEAEVEQRAKESAEKAQISYKRIDLLTR
jgi:tyrosinase